MTEQRTCIECGKKFSPVRAWQEFCRSYCRLKYWRKAQREEADRLAAIVKERNTPDAEFISHEEFWKETEQ